MEGTAAAPPWQRASSARDLLRHRRSVGARRRGTTVTAASQPEHAALPRRPNCGSAPMTPPAAPDGDQQGHTSPKRQAAAGAWSARGIVGTDEPGCCRTAGKGGRLRMQQQQHTGSEVLHGRRDASPPHKGGTGRLAPPPRTGAGTGAGSDDELLLEVLHHRRAYLSEQASSGGEGARGSHSAAAALSRDCRAAVEEVGRRAREEAMQSVGISTCIKAALRGTRGGCAEHAPAPISDMAGRGDTQRGDAAVSAVRVESPAAMTATVDEQLAAIAQQRTNCNGFRFR
jgi:hypothetical protein